jgi:hypothetical protein
LIAQYPMFWMNIWTYEIGQGHGYLNGAAQYATSWRDSEGTYFDAGDPDLSPDGAHIAVTDGGDTNSNTRLLIGHVNGPIWTGSFPYPEPEYLDDTPAADTGLDCSWTADREGAVWNPTWSPDSSRLAISAPDGVHIFSNPATTDVDLADKPSPPKTDNGNQGTGPGSPSQPSGPAAAGLSKLKLKPRAFLASKRGGSTLSYTLAAPARITITVKRGGTSVKGSIKTAGKPGANKQRFTGRTAKRKLRPGKYTLVVTASPVDGGAGQTSTAPFRIVR